MIAKIRRIIQIAILIMVVAVTYFNHYENQKAKYGGHMIIEASPVLRLIDRVAGAWKGRTQILTFVQGDVWAAQIGKYKIVDPLALMGNFSRTKKIYGRLFWATILPISLTILLGKIFCSWICPMGLLFEINAKFRRWMIKRGMPLLTWKLPHGLKYAVLGFGIITGLLFGSHFFLAVYPPKLVSGEIYFWVARSAFSGAMAFICFLLGIELMFAPRLWCRSLCPGGALYTLLNRLRVVRIKNDLKNCIDCGICDRACPYEINPSKGHLSAECDHCAICIAKCPVDTLSLIVGKDREIPAPLARASGEKKMAQSISLFVVLLSFLFLPANVYAHHIRGLPHYGYVNNYPQIPTYEEIRTVDDWEITFTFIKIFESKNCDLAVYIKNRTTGKPFTQGVTFRVFEQREDPNMTHPFNAHFDPTNTYRVGWVYEEDGIYVVRIAFGDWPKSYVEDFRIQLGEAPFNFAWLIFPGAMVAVLIGLNVHKRLRSRETKSEPIDELCAL